MQANARYGAGAIALHWLLALTIAGQLGLGFAMPPGPAGFALFQLHKSIGILILMLTVVRIGWRLAHPVPPSLEHGWLARLAGAVHFGLYTFMLIAPLTGWALVSTARVKVPTIVFGVLPLPHLPLPHSLSTLSRQSHEIIAFIGIALIALHVIGALRHHVLLRDGTLARMAPRGSTAAVFALILAGATLFALPFGLRQSPPRAERTSTPELETVNPSPQPTELPAVKASEPPEPEATADEPSPPPQWAVAPGGILRFTVGNGGETISGRFSRWSAQIAFDPDAPESATLQVDVDLASASVGDATQDSMLQGEDFLNSASASRARWKSTSVTRSGSGYLADGLLTLRGTSHAVPVRFTLSGTGDRRRASGHATIDRAAFGIGAGEAGAALSPQVNVEFSFDAARR